MTVRDAPCYNWGVIKVLIELPQELCIFVDSSVEAGRFHNASEMVANALHILKGDERAKFEALRADLAIGIEQANRGLYVEYDADSIKAKGRALLLASPFGK